MSSVVKVKINNKGLEKELELINKIGKARVKVGVQADAGIHSESGESLVDIGIWNEYGTAHIPSRPFIRQTFEDNQQALAQYLGRVVENVAKGDDLVQELSKLGQWYQDKQKKTLTSYPWTPNAPSTRRRKKSSKPLVDTSQLVNSIRYKVEI
ncbi:TPA: hypothetical protein ACPIWO_000468 [Haemophilus influenzae]|uniref:Mu-like prophage protein gpG n=2 Tax=Haemophilus influenzae TaxID=727 RepID=Q4QKV4_HAEI8|nr:hypothetical protein [Haemophilus influenzae]DAO38235.1 MAG TPA: virion morphogenesis protein [Caudoviricetes sp.]AAX88343.1 hypothetical protein NTHI1535 [Haemophilus influenzae 86-028NP]AJO88415.1 Mu-like prophage protein gpG [Haemophilus influenzae]KMZ17668.1 hypothetical protein ABN27_03240 [Haemophilus influenzae]MCK8888477.1 hypothetical protein [Haemophilus influenzae]